MIRSVTTEALVISRHPLGEKDEVVLLFTPRLGCVKAVARGARKPTSVMVGALEPFNHLTVQLVKGRSMFKVAQVKPRRSFAGITVDLERIGYASFLLEVFRRSVWEGVDSKKIFELLLVCLEGVEKGKKVEGVCLWGLLRLLRILGYAPCLHQCVGCGSREGLKFFSPQGGGIVCSRCERRYEDRLSMSEGLSSVLRYLERCSKSAALRLRLSLSQFLAALNIVTKHCSYHCPGAIDCSKALRLYLYELCENL